MKEASFYGMAVICDSYGRVEKILRNDLCENLPLKEQSSLSSVIETHSVQKFFTFMYRLKEEKALYDWNINIVCDSSIVELYFVGGMFEDKIIIVASTSRKVARTYFSELMEINNEQTNLIRTTMKQNADSGMYGGTGGKDRGNLLSTDMKQATSREEEEEMYRDFTRLNNELANLQRSLQKKNKKLEQTIKERDKYIGMAAHDLRNPLSGFTGMCRLLLEEEMGELNEDQREIVDLMRDNADYMLSMVNEMLDISAIEFGTLKLNRENTDLMEIMRRSIALNGQPAKKKRISIHKRTEVEQLKMSIDKVKINQVLDNLISNAIKYSHPESEINVIVTVPNASLEDSTNASPGEPPNDKEVRIEIRDEGQGIPEEDISKLFDPFSKVKVETTDGEKSTGLGLTISRRIVRGHGGEIHVHSKVGEGSAFVVTLPLQPREEEEP